MDIPFCSFSPLSHHLSATRNDGTFQIWKTQCADLTGGYTEGIFFVPTKMGGLRPVINHSVSNTYYWFMVPYYNCYFSFMYWQLA
jgi:hypothetical protein